LGAEAIPQSPTVGGHQYWRLRLTNTPGPGPWLTELQMDGPAAWAYSYDDMNRLLAASSPGVALAFAYDRYDNRWQQNVTAGSGFAPNFAFDLNDHISLDNSITYDVAGNLTNNGAGVITYDAEERIATAAGVTYTYDGDGKRVQKSNGILYWTGTGIDPLTETDASGNPTADYVFFNGKRMARVDLPGGSVHYYFSDHLGSASVITDATGSTIELEADYYPFGGERAITAGDAL
jgi:hypothetical protein